MIAVAPLFSSLEDWTIYTHTPKAGVTLGDLQMLQKRLVVFRFTVPVENPDIGIPKSASCKGESSMFALPDSRLAVANPR